MGVVDEAATSSQTKFYGYRIAAATVAVGFLLGGFPYALSVLGPLMAKEFMWSATALGGAFTMFSLGSGFAGPIIGPIVVKIKPRLAIIVGSILMAVSLAFLSTTNAIWQFYLFVALLDIGIVLGQYLPCQQLMGNWFAKRRGTMLGIVLAGANMGGFVMPNLTSSLVTSLGSWQVTWRVLIPVVLLAAVLSVLVIRNRPEDVGQVPDGPGRERAGEGEAKKGASAVYKSAHSWELRDALRTSSFWLLVVAYSVMGFLYNANTSQVVNYLHGEVQVDLALAASVVGAVAGISVVGNMGVGWLGDRIQTRHLMSALQLCMGLGFVLLLTKLGTPAYYGYSLLFGIGFGGTIVMSSAAMQNYYGPASFSAIIGVAMPIAKIIGSLSPIVLGGIKDLTGSFVPGFLVMVVVGLLGAVCAFLATPPKPREAHLGAQASATS